MDRNDVVQGVLDLFAVPHYLEIGVFEGKTFHGVKADRKVAVDPAFQFDHEAAAREHPECAYHEMPSDTYFGGVARGERFDVIYIDGLHTFEQTLRDLINALSVIGENGVIIIDDVFPDSFPAALPDYKEFRAVRKATGLKSKNWMGDVYKLVFFIETFFQSWTFGCITDNHGQLIMWQQPRSAVKERRVEQIGLAGYDRALIERDAFRFAPYDAILAKVRRAREPGRA